MVYNNTDAVLTTGVTESEINIWRNTNPETILMNTCALTSVISCAPKILKKIAGTTQYIPPNGIPKSRKGNCPSVNRYAPSHDRNMFTLKGKLKRRGKEAKATIINTSKAFNIFFCAILNNYLTKIYYTNQFEGIWSGNISIQRQRLGKIMNYLFRY